MGSLQEIADSIDNDCASEPLDIPHFLLNTKRTQELYMKMIVHVSIPTFYKFEGWIFEYSRTKPFGPWPCTKNLEPRKHAGRKFYDMFGRFERLTINEQADLEI